MSADESRDVRYTYRFLLGISTKNVYISPRYPNPVFIKQMISYNLVADQAAETPPVPSERVAGGGAAAAASTPSATYVQPTLRTEGWSMSSRLALKGVILHSVVMPTQLRELLRPLRLLLKGVTCVQTLEEAEALLPKPAWFHHRSRYGLTKRYIMTLNDPRWNRGYAFARQRTPGVDWNNIPNFPAVVKILNKLWNEDFTMCHANMYNITDGKMDGLSAHSDSETDLNKGKPIVCVSLGNWPMRIIFTEKASGRKACEKLVPPNSIYVMGGTTQEHLTHRVCAPTKKQLQLVGLGSKKPAHGKHYRISLTFRVTKQQAPQ